MPELGLPPQGPVIINNRPGVPPELLMMLIELMKSKDDDDERQRVRTQFSPFVNGD